jgi:hypothetical protein
MRLPALCSLVYALTKTVISKTQADEAAFLNNPRISI